MADIPIPTDIARIRHLTAQMHRSEDDAGDPIDEGFLLGADGARGHTWYDPSGIGGASSLATLTDVTLTSPQENDTLRYISGDWVNDNRRWEPVTFNPGTGPEIVFFGDDITMTWENY